MKRRIVKTSLMLVLLSALLCVRAYSEEEAQTASAPAINVYLSNAETGSANASPGELTRVRAKVVYEGCEEGKEYTLVLRLEDTASGAVCSFSDGSGMLKQTFTAEGRAGIFDFEFSIDAVLFSGRTLAEMHYIEEFESAYQRLGSENAGHIYVPGMRTDAVSESGDKTVLAGRNSVICDVVSYYGLAPAEEYRIVTGLKDSLTGEVIRGSDGNPVSATSVFTPSEPNGQIAAKITVNLREYGNRDITVFENLYIVPKNGIPFLLLSSDGTSLQNRTVFAGLTQISVLDELYRVPVSGAGLRVTSLADGFTFEAVSNEEGICSFPLDRDERCSCTFISVPYEYVPFGGSVEFTPSESEGGSALELLLLKKNTIVLTRTDAESGLPVQGIVSEVRDADGRLLSTVFTDEDGKARFDANVLWDEAAAKAEKDGKDSFILTVSFHDTSTPSIYFPKEGTWTVSIDENGNITGLTELQSVRRQSVTIKVVNGKGNGIPQAELSVIGPDGSIQGRAITDPEGKIYFTPKRTGEYRLVEDSVPPGYARSLGKNQFTVEEDGGVSGTLAITNFSEDFATGVTAVVIMTVLFLALWFSARLFVKKAIIEQIKESLEKVGKHSR